MAKNLVPFNIEAEKAVIGSMIASKKVCFNALNMLDAIDFYDEKANQVIFTAIKNLDLQGKEVDNASVATELQTNMKLLDQIGGVDYLAELQDYYIGDKNAEHHIRTVRDLSLVRKLFNKVHNLEKEFFEKRISNVSDFIEKFDNEVKGITQNRSSGEFVTTGEVITAISQDLKRRRYSGARNGVTGVPSGYEALDRLTSGWQPGSLNIIAARPSVGKTAFALNLIYNAANLTGKTVAFFSLEMAAKDIATRMLSSCSAINSYDLKSGNLKDTDWMAIQEAEDALNRVNILIDDTSGIKLGEIKTKCTKLKAKDPSLSLIVIDYLGLITLNNPKQDNRQNIDEISRSLKGLARDLDLPVICLCQLSRANEKAGRKPIMSDLRDSGSIEQDADTVLFLHRDDYQKQVKNGEEINDNKDDLKKGPFEKMSLTDIILQKNRNGETGAIKLPFMLNIGKFLPPLKDS